MTSNPDRLNVSDDSLDRARRIIEILRADFALGTGRRLVVGVAGESGSGKSVAATSLAHELDRAGIPARVLHQDDYFVLPPRTNHEHRLVDIHANVGPHEVRLALIAEHIAAFRAGRDGVEAPLVDYPGNRFVTQRHDFGSSQVLVVEGTYVLALDALDVRIFCSATHVETAARRAARNRDIQDPVIDRILDLEHQLIAATGATADIRIDIDFQLHRRS